MAEQGYISEEERDMAKQEELVFRGRDNNMIAPHFVMYIKGILSEKYGEKTIEQGGLKIYTTLDLYKQKIAEEVITEKTENYPEKYKAHNAALVSIDPKTGEILAMVGSRDYFNNEIDGQVNVTIRPRQPGSSMKPIVYAALFEKGYTPDTILYDVKTNFSTNPSEPYSPNNYDGKERGPVSIRQALAGSLNIPAVKAIYLTNINTVLDLTDNLGYSTLYPRNRFGLSLVLGGGEIKMIEHVNAYSAFARDGKINSLVSILKVEDKDGRILEEAKPQEKKVLDSQVARMINNILSDNEARSYVFGPNNNLTLGERPIAAKTGTTNNFRDAWTIGYTPSLVTGVWVGNSNNDEMSGKADGSVIAAPIWQEFMKRVLGNTPYENFKEPDDYVTGKAILDGQVPSNKVKIDKSSGLLASDLTPWELIEEIEIPSRHSILFYVDKDNPRGEIPKNPENDPQFNIWEEAIKKWVQENSTSSEIILPDNYSEHHLPENKPSLEILSPKNNESTNQTTLEIKIKATAKRGISRTEYYLNNNLWQTKLGKSDFLRADFNFLSNGYHSLKVRVCDDVLNCTDQTINFNVLIKDNPITTIKNSLQITYPSSGLALNSNDFPLPLNFSISLPNRVSQIKFFLKNEANQASHFQTAIDNLNTNNAITFNSPPDPGTYYLFGELYDWNGDVIKSEEIVLVVN
jgi:membrane peptidoglycan carboxypeptidase